MNDTEPIVTFYVYVINVMKRGELHTVNFINYSYYFFYRVTFHHHPVRQHHPQFWISDPTSHLGLN